MCVYVCRFFILLLLFSIVSLGKDLFVWQHIFSLSVLVNSSLNVEYDAIECKKIL